MPLTVTCPSCTTRVTAPDKLAGRTVKCPKCRSAFTLPSPDTGFEVIEDDEPVVAKPKVKPPAVAQGYTLVEDDEPERPKPKKQPKRRPILEDEDEFYPVPRRRSAGGSSAGHTRMFVALGGGLVFLAVVAGGIYYASDKIGSKPTTATPATTAEPPKPVVWARFSPRGGGFAVMLPETPTPPKEQRAGGAGGLLGAESQGWEVNHADLNYKIGVVTIPQGLPGGATDDLILDTLIGELGKRAEKDPPLTQTAATLGKFAARQLAFVENGEHTLLRVAIVANKVFLFTVSRKDKPVDVAEEGVRKFFESITIS